jgi:predicted nucleic acid-binding protein
MAILVDTNVWLRTSQPDHPKYEEANHATKSLLNSGQALVVVPQVLYEFWVVATRPTAVNGLGFSALRTDAEVDEILRVGTLYKDDSLVFPWWRSIVAQYQIVGKKAHDARLVAAMLRHGVVHILTFNEQDFSRFNEVVVVHPAAVGNLPPASP